MLNRFLQFAKKAITWIEFDRKTDILAFAAFLLGLGGIVSQLSGYLRGPDVELFAPHQVLFHYEERQRGKPLIRFGAILAYTNSGQTGYNTTVRRELLKYSIDGKEFYQVWQKFVETDVRYMKGKETGTLEIQMKSVASPFPLNAGGSSSHETYFHPASTLVDKGEKKELDHSNFVTSEQFDGMIGKVGDAPISVLFEFIAEVPGSSPSRTACRVQIDDDLRKWLRCEKWIAPRCWESAERTDIRIDNI